MRIHNTQAVVIKISRRQECEPSTLRTFGRLKVCAYKKPRQSGQQSVRIQSALCEVAFEENSCGLKVSAVGRKANSFMRGISNKPVIVIVVVV